MITRIESWFLDHGAQIEDARTRIGAAAGVFGLVLLAAAVSLWLTGCATTAYGRQAQAAQMATLVTGATGEALDAARDSALDAVEAEHPAHGPERTAALEAEAARWRPAGQALDALRSAIVLWVTAIEAARAMGEQGASVLWPRVIELAAAVADLYARLAALAAEMGVSIPALPAGLGNVAPAAPGDDAADGRGAHREHPSDVQVALAAGDKPSDLAHLLVVKLGAALPDAPRQLLGVQSRYVTRSSGRGCTANRLELGTARLAPLRVAVGHVVGVSAEEEVVGVYARADVTPVEHVQSVRNRPAVEFPRDPVRSPGELPVTDHSVAVAVAVGGPEPASAVCDLHLLGKALAKGARLSPQETSRLVEHARGPVLAELRVMTVAQPLGAVAFVASVERAGLMVVHREKSPLVCGPLLNVGTQHTMSSGGAQ